MIGGLLAVAILASLAATASDMVLAQPIGRIACVITGDAMGKPASVPFGYPQMI